MSRKVQCKACPWKKSTNPHRDIPGGYNAERHRQLIACQAPNDLGVLSGQPIRAMACHHSKPGREFMCVGWAMNQLGPGNNIGLRIRALSGEFKGLRTVGEQHESMEAMCSTAGESPTDD